MSKSIVYHNTRFCVSCCPDPGGGVNRIEHRRMHSPTEMFARLSMSGVINDIKARGAAVASRPEFLALREQYYQDVENRQSAPRGLFVQRQDLEQTRKDVLSRLNKAFSSRLKEIAKQKADNEKKAFDMAVESEVARRLSQGNSNPKDVG